MSSGFEVRVEVGIPMVLLHQCPVVQVIVLPQNPEQVVACGMHENANTLSSRVDPNVAIAAVPDRSANSIAHPV